MEYLDLLLLEDDADDAELIIRTLERSGMALNVKIANDKESFLNAINTLSFQAILADNSLPQFDAVSALKLVKDINLEIPFILVTGSISEEFAVNIMKEGAWDYILKDRLQRLPNAILSAINKYTLEADRKKYLDYVIKNEALMKQAESIARFGSWELDVVNNIERWSDEHYRILGFQPGEVTASLSKFQEFIHPQDVSFVKQKTQEAFERLNRQQFECRIICNKNTTKYINCELVIKRDEQGKVLHVNGISRDISETKHAGELLQKSEANLHTIFDNTETGYILLDTCFNIVSMNQQVYRFSQEQLDRPFIEGENVIDFYNDDNRVMIEESLIKALNGISVTYEIPYIQPDGSSKWYSTGYHAVCNSDKTPLGIIMTQTDITSRKMLELQEKMITADLIQRKNELEQFTFIVSHNLRNPVANIIGINDLLKGGRVSDHEKKFLMEGLTNSVEKLDTIIVDLNDIMQAKQSVNESRETVHFAAIVDDVLLSIKNIVDKNFLELRQDFAEFSDMFTVKSYMYSIFYNLISNSIKYRRPDVPLVVDIRSRKNYNSVELIFSDNGVGIDLEKKGSQVFGLYRRFHTDLSEGKGMGLFMVKTHVETLGGKISIKSEVNKGTEFTIRFESPELKEA